MLFANLKIVQKKNIKNRIDCIIYAKLSIKLTASNQFLFSQSANRKINPHGIFQCFVLKCIFQFLIGTFLIKLLILIFNPHVARFGWRQQTDTLESANNNGYSHQFKTIFSSSTDVESKKLEQVFHIKYSVLMMMTIELNQKKELNQRRIHKMFLITETDDRKND